MTSLVMLLEQIVIGTRQPPASSREWFLIKLDGLLPLASHPTAQRIEQIKRQIQTAQEKLQPPQPSQEWPRAAQQALSWMKQLLLSTQPQALQNRSAIASDRHPLFTGRDEARDERRKAGRTTL